MKISFAPRADEFLKGLPDVERRRFLEEINASAKDASTRSEVGMIALTVGRRAVVMMADGSGGFVVQAITP